jgi:hypothetical protein
MAIDIFFYAALDSVAANKLIHDLKISREDLFLNDFILNAARETTIVHKEIAGEHEFIRANSIFLLRLNNKEAAAEFLQAAEVVREHFGFSNVLLLLENERKI